MERKELFKKTMDALWKAYKGNHLIHGGACGCAVGNLVCNAMNQTKFLIRTRESLDGSTAWTGAISCHLNEKYVDPHAKRQVKATGYTLEEISMIEHAFEFRHSDGSSKFEGFDGPGTDKSGKLGFINVLKTLGKIHDAPEVAKCLIDHVKKDTYTYETAAFRNYEPPKPKKVKTKIGEISLVK